MTDLTYAILKARYAPDSLLQQVEVAEPEPEPVEVEKTAITLEKLLLQVRNDMLSSWGLNPEHRHSFADDVVALATLQKCGEYNVTNMSSGGTE